jgi:hypothetical protein
MSKTIDFFQLPYGYSNFLEKFKETDNIIYNVINYQEPETIFFYGFLLIIVIYASSKINFNYSILVGLIFYSIFIYYLYTDKKVNDIDEFNKLNTKYELLNTNNNILKKYPNIIDYLFYMSEIKSTSPRIYFEIQTLFEQFIILYEACLQDITLINQNYTSLITIKDKILYSINFCTFNLLSNVGSIKLYDMRRTVEKLLNHFLEELVILQKKDIYYNSYNTRTIPIDISNIKPSNFLDTQNQYIRNTKQYDVLNLYLL